MIYLPFALSLTTSEFSTSCMNDPCEHLSVSASLLVSAPHHTGSSHLLRQSVVSSRVHAHSIRPTKQENGVAHPSTKTGAEQVKGLVAHKQTGNVSANKKSVRKRSFEGLLGFIKKIQIFFFITSCHQLTEQLLQDTNL